MLLAARAAALGACLALAGCLSVPGAGEGADGGGDGPVGADAAGSPGCTTIFVDEFAQELDGGVWYGWETGDAQRAVIEDELRYTIPLGGAAGTGTIARFDRGGLRFVVQEAVQQEAVMVEIELYDLADHIVIARRDGKAVEVELFAAGEVVTTIPADQAGDGPWVFDVGDATTRVRTSGGRDVDVEPAFEGGVQLHLKGFLRGSTPGVAAFASVRAEICE